MLLDGEDVIFCLGKAKEMTEQYKLYCLSPEVKRSVDELLKICGEYLGKKVEIHELYIPAEDNEIRGLYMANSDGTFDIYVLAELGFSERRFVQCKELFHVILDQERCRSMDIYAHLENATTSFYISDEMPNSPVTWELLAEIAAMEFMLPYSDRVSILQQCNGDPDFVEISRRYGIPQVHVEIYMSSRMMEEVGRLQW